METAFLFRPISPFKLSQSFGENKACVDIKTGKQTIFCDGLNPPAGYKSVYSKMKGHNGLDLYAISNTPIFSAQDGTVVEVVDENARGLGISVLTKNKFFCIETGKPEYFVIRYWHNKANYVRVGDKVSIGDFIATADNTGFSSGDHLHFELKPVTYTIKKDGTYNVKNILQSNGYFGAVNPLPYVRTENARSLQGLVSTYERILWAISPK